MISLPKEYAFAANLQRGTKGRQATLVQEWLALHNCGTAIDADFGSATEAAVQRFQQKNKLPITGIVDSTTFEALTAPIRTALQPITAGKKTLGELVVAYAARHLQQHPREIGGENKGPWVRLYMGGKQGKAYPWCAGFVSFILRQAADTLGTKPPFASTFSCDVLAELGKKTQRFVAEKDMASGQTPRRDMTVGSLFLVRKKPGDWTHTGIVLAFHDDYIETIEGNTNDSGSREGYEVCQRMRGYLKKDFIRV